MENGLEATSKHNFLATSRSLWFTLSREIPIRNTECAQGLHVLEALGKCWNVCRAVLTAQPEGPSEVLPPLSGSQMRVGKEPLSSPLPTMWMDTCPNPATLFYQPALCPHGPTHSPKCFTGPLGYCLPSPMTSGKLSCSFTALPVPDTE